MVLASTPLKKSVYYMIIQLRLDDYTFLTTLDLIDTFRHSRASLRVTRIENK